MPHLRGKYRSQLAEEEGAGASEGCEGGVTLTGDSQQMQPIGERVVMREPNQKLWEAVLCCD